MSTKIYTAYRAVSTDPFEVGRQIRKLFNPIFFKGVMKIEETIESRPEDTLQDIFWLPKPLKKGRWIEKSAFDVIETLKNQSTHTFSDADISYEVVLMPSAADNRVLLIVFSECGLYEKALDKSELFEDFGYWDNTDPDEDVTEAEWKHREKSWGYLIEDDETPASIGLSITNPGSMAYELWKIKKARKK